MFTSTSELVKVHFHTTQQLSDSKPCVGKNWPEKLREAALDMQPYAMKIFFFISDFKWKMFQVAKSFNLGK